MAGATLSDNSQQQNIYQEKILALINSADERNYTLALTFISQQSNLLTPLIHKAIIEKVKKNPKDYDLRYSSSPLNGAKILQLAQYNLKSITSFHL